MAETELRHISPEVRGRLQTTRCLGYDPSPKKEGMPRRLLMAHGRESGKESTPPACMKPHLPTSTPCQGQ